MYGCRNEITSTFGCEWGLLMCLYCCHLDSLFYSLLSNAVGRISLDIAINGMGWDGIR